MSAGLARPPRARSTTGLAGQAAGQVGRRRARGSACWRGPPRWHWRWRSRPRPCRHGAGARVGRPGQGAARRLPHRRDRLRPAGDVGLLLATHRARRSSSRSTSTTTSRGRTGSCRTRRRRCRRSRRTAGRGRSGSGRASTSPTIRRSRARSASSPRTTTSTRGSACSTRRCARRTFRSSTASSSGADDGAREGEAGRASSTTTRRSRACARSTATRCSSSWSSPTTFLHGYLTHAAMAAVAREVIEAYGDASGWAMANPVGTGPFRLEEWRRGQRIVLEANPNYREESLPARPATPADAPMLARDEGQAAAAGRPRRDLDHRGVESAAARVQQRRARLRRRAAPTSSATCSTPATRCKPDYAKRGRDAAHARRSRRSRFTYFNMDDPGRRRLHAGQGRAAPRDRRWATTPTS